MRTRAQLGSPRPGGPAWPGARPRPCPFVETVARRSARALLRAGSAAAPARPARSRTARGATSPARARAGAPQLREVGARRVHALHHRGARATSRGAPRAPRAAPRSAGGTGQRRRDVGVDGAEHGAVGEVQPDPRRACQAPAARDPRRAARCRRRGRRRRAGRAAAAPPTPRRRPPPRGRRAGSWSRRGMSADTVTSGPPRGTRDDAGRNATRRAPRPRTATSAVNPLVYWLVRGAGSRSSTSTSACRGSAASTSRDGPVIFARTTARSWTRSSSAPSPAPAVYYVAKEELFRNRCRLVPERARRVPGPPRRGRPGHARDREGDPRARRLRAHVRRGHAHPAGSLGAPSAASAGSRSRPARRRPRRRDRHGGVRNGLAHPAAQGPHPHRRPLTFPQVEQPSRDLAAAVTDRIWPNVMLQWEWLGGLPPLRRAAVIGAGSWGTAARYLAAPG